MKKNVFFIFTLLLISISFASVSATPDQELTYHGKLTDNLGLAVPNGSYDFTLTIYDAPTGGSVLWTDIETLTVTNGIFSTTLTGLDTLTFDQNYYLGVQINTNSEMTPRRKITPTGFALNAHRLNGLSADNYIDTSAIAQTKQGDLIIGGDLTIDGALYDSNGQSGSNGQILSSTSAGTDWIDAPVAGSTTFLGLTDTPSSYTAGSLLFTSSSAVTENNANLFWNDTTNRLGIGTNNPSSKLTILGSDNGLRLAYDVFNYANLSVDSSGGLTISASDAAESAILIGSGSTQDTSIQFDGFAHDFFSGIDHALGAYAIGVGTDVTATATLTGPGTVTNTAGDTTVTGTNTSFLSTFRIGNTITIGSDTVTIATIASNTSMTTTTISSAHTNATYTYNGGTKMTVEPSGNVGIGNTDPLYALDVRTTGSDTIIARFNNASTNTSCTLTASGGTINCSSDERLKKNFGALNNGLETIMQLRPATYNWKYEDNGAPYTMGFIAQEVENVLPQLVITDPSTGYKQLSTIGMIPVITKAVQEQNTLINAIMLSQKVDQTSLYDLANLIDTIPADDTALSAISNNVLAIQKDASVQANVIKEIQDRMTEIENMHADLTDFFVRIDADRLVYTDENGKDLTIEGIVSAQSLETEVLAMTGKEEEARIGVAAIAEDAYDVFVTTGAVTYDSRIFVTPRGDVITQPLVVTRIDDGSGFHVTVAEPVDKPLAFDWMIVDDRVIHDKDAKELYESAFSDENHKENDDSQENEQLTNELSSDQDVEAPASENQNIDGDVVNEISAL